MSARFATTQWSQVLAARDGSDTRAQKALAGLCDAYWLPLYAFVRRSGHDAEESRDLTQAFFAYLLEKNVLEQVEPSAGRFRSFVLASLKHFVANEHRRERALKRGGGVQTVSLDAEEAERRFRYEPTTQVTPEAVFEYRWAMAVLEQALTRLQTEWTESGKEQQFERLKPHLTGQEPRAPFRELGEDLDMSEVAARGAMYRLRQRLGELIREEVADTVADVDQVEQEVRHLLGILGR
jgi:RNA polymerase sigma factor (sigma-70 family)